MTTNTIRRAQATSEPITLDEAKAHLRVLHDHEDSLITRYLAAARGAAEEFCERLFSSGQFACITDSFGCIELAPETTAIASISYRDVDNVRQTIPDTDYTFDLDRQLLEPVDSWPDGDRVTVEYFAGPDFSDSPPAFIADTVVGGILEILGDIYNNRESQIVGGIISVNQTARNLLQPHRRNLGV